MWTRPRSSHSALKKVFSTRRQKNGTRWNFSLQPRVSFPHKKTTADVRNHLCYAIARSTSAAGCISSQMTHVQVGAFFKEPAIIFERIYPPSIIHLWRSPSIPISLLFVGISPDDESDGDSLLGDCPVPCDEKSSAVSGMWSSWLLMFVLPLWQLLFIDLRRISLSGFLLHAEVHARRKILDTILTFVF